MSEPSPEQAGPGPSHGNTDPSAAPQPDGQASESLTARTQAITEATEASSPEQRTPEYEAAMRWQENIGLIRSNPQAAAERIDLEGIKGFIRRHTVRNIGAITVNPTVMKITRNERARGKGALGNAHGISPFGKRSDDGLHTDSIFRRKKALYLYDKDRKKQLSEMRDGSRLSEEDVELLAAVIERNRKRVEELYPNGELEDIGGAQGRVTPALVESMLRNDVIGFKQTLAQAARDAMPDQPGERTPGGAEMQDAQTSGEVQIASPFEQLLNSSFTEMSARVRNNQPEVINILNEALQNASSQGMSDLTAGRFNRRIEHLAATMPDKDDTSDAGLQRFGWYVRSIMNLAQELADEAGQATSRKEAPPAAENQPHAEPAEPAEVKKASEPLLEKIISSSKEDVLRIIEDKPGQIIILFDRLIPRQNEHDRTVKNVLRQLADGTLKMKDMDKSKEGASLAGYVKGRLRSAARTKN